MQGEAMRLTRFIGTIAAVFLAAPAVAATTTTAAVADFSACAKPEWPKEALRLGQKGTVTLAFQIGVDGAVADSKVVKSSGFPLLDIAARDGILKCRFKPGTRDGKAQAAWMKMQYVWTLERKAPDPVAIAAAFETDREAAEGGDAAAALRVARYYLSTVNAERDPGQGTWWLRKAAEGGDLEAMEYLALMLFRGVGMPRDQAEAARWIEGAAERNSPSAQVILGQMLLRGDGVTKNEAEGEAWLRKAAEQDYPRGQIQLAQWLLHREAMDAGTVAMLERAVARDDAQARVLLGICYERGAGVAQDYARARELYAKAAASGYDAGRRALANMYDKGLGVPEDKVAAKALLRQAASAGAAPARTAAAGQ
jgi:TonB family protein